MAYRGLPGSEKICPEGAKEGLTTYWLYRGKEVLTGVRLPEGTSREKVIGKAVRNHRMVSLHHEGYTPFEFEQALLRAEVRR